MKFLVLISLISGVAGLRIIQSKPNDVIQVKSLKVQCIVMKDSLHCHNYNKFPRLEWALYKNKLTVWERSVQEELSPPLFEVEIPAKP